MGRQTDGWMNRHEKSIPLSHPINTVCKGGVEGGGWGGEGYKKQNGKQSTCCRSRCSVQARNFSFGAQGLLPSKKLGTIENIWGQHNFFFLCLTQSEHLMILSSLSYTSHGNNRNQGSWKPRFIWLLSFSLVFGLSRSLSAAAAGGEGSDWLLVDWEGPFFT